MALDSNSPEYLDIPLVLDAESSVVLLDIRAARKYEQEKGARRIAEKIKVELPNQGKVAAASIAMEPLPYDVQDIRPRREARRGPVVDSDLPEIIIRHHPHPSRPPTTNQTHPQTAHGPRPVVRTAQHCRPVDRGAHVVAARAQQSEHLRAQQTLRQQDRGVYPDTHTHVTRPQEAHRARQAPVNTLPVEARHHKGHPADRAAVRSTITAIPPSSFYAAIPRPRPVPPLQHPHRVPPVRQQVVPQHHRSNAASQRLAQGLREEVQPRPSRNDIQLSSLTRSLLAGGGGLPAPLLIPRHNTLTTPSSPIAPIRQRRSTVQLSDDDLMDTSPDAYHQALQCAEYEDTINDTGHWQEAGLAEVSFTDDDSDGFDVFGAYQAPDPYYRGREYREGMAGPSREEFLPTNEDRSRFGKNKPPRRHE